jgi:phosphatidylethanolamine/phosphatidyl-N-methylethanolamine N-methyltransferase
VTIDAKATELTRARYQRIASVYDPMEGLMEGRYEPWRERIWSMVKGPKVLEAGVGTGKNISHYPQGMDITAIDLTPGMLERAQRQAETLNVDVDLQVGDAQSLPYPDSAFDDVIATFLFCSVPDPVLGLRELRRVVKPDGQVLLLEHMRSPNPVLGALMDVVNPVTVRMTGANINRRTVENVRRSGLHLDQVEDLAMGGVFKLIVASKGT